MSQFQTIQDIDIAGKRLLIRVDFNVPLKDGEVASHLRIAAALPTIRYALDHGARIVLMAHLGRPGGQPDCALSLSPVADRLRTMLDGPSVKLVEDLTVRADSDQQDHEIILLENLRFHPGEKEADDEFCDQLARWGDVYVNDAFAACHRKHASTYGVTERFTESDRAIGLLVERELNGIDGLLESADRPFVVVLGGVKVAGKIGVVDRLLQRADTICVGGAMAYTFLKAAAKHVGASKVEDKLVGFAKQLVTYAGDRLILPIDHVIADQPNESAQIESADGGIPDGWYGMDIGPKTIEAFTRRVYEAGTVIWNGPLGKFEDGSFRHGTEAIVRAIAETKARSLVGGGESLQAVEQFGVVDAIDHVSTGGGAFLTYLKDGELPALQAMPKHSAVA